jgi:hypothetical protein
MFFIATGSLCSGRRYAAAVRVDDRRGTADDERFAAFEKIRDDLGERLRAVGSARVPGIVDEDEIERAVREACPS